MLIIKVSDHTLHLLVGTSLIDITGARISASVPTVRVDDDQFDAIAGAL